jgi:hypothetical protein
VRNPKQPTPEPAPDWRGEAEARGRAAFEAATAEPAPKPAEPLAWLWEGPMRRQDKPRKKEALRA